MVFLIDENRRVALATRGHSAVLITSQRSVRNKEPFHWKYASFSTGSSPATPEDNWDIHTFSTEHMLSSDKLKVYTKFIYYRTDELVDKSALKRLDEIIKSNDNYDVLTHNCITTVCSIFEAAGFKTGPAGDAYHKKTNPNTAFKWFQDEFKKKDYSEKVFFGDWPKDFQKIADLVRSKDPRVPPDKAQNPELDARLQRHTKLYDELGKRLGDWRSKENHKLFEQQLQGKISHRQYDKEFERIREEYYRKWDKEAEIIRKTP